MGLLNAVFACVIPTINDDCFSKFLLKAGLPIVKGMTQAVTPVVGVMLFHGYSFISKAKSNLGWIVTIVIGLVSLILYQFMNVHPAFVIGALLAYGLLGGRVNLKDKKEKQ